MIKEQILKKLEQLENGFLEVELPNKEKLYFGQKDSALKADIKIKDLSMIDLVIAKGDIGFGKSYIEDLFETSDLVKLLYFFSLNQEKINHLIYGQKFFTFIYSLKNLLRINNNKGSKKNISFHYDLGNDFYSLWLDETMTYSSGIFFHEEGLHQAQEQKYQRILDHINQSGKSILEIGCGWGGFMEAAAKKGFEVQGLTLSKEQLKFANERCAAQNLNSHAIFRDYRDEKNTFDNIVSIEMFEAVGQEYWNQYFSKVKNCLKPEGKAVIQTITISEDAFEKYQKTSDYIREFIFPGGFLPTKTIFKNLAQNNQLKTIDSFEFGSSYDKTLCIWLNNFDSVKNQILSLGFDEKFIRKWRFYLAYCAAAFRSGRIDVVQYSFSHL